VRRCSSVQVNAFNINTLTLEHLNTFTKNIKKRALHIIPVNLSF
jgi:hypothetical protein